ncbi:MAG: bifunctional DNA-formamidopyrimidine glycosylase/DNA-(apurinic or apyrimidinic site) lyase [Bryobacteraceae bacterium]|jgi:formamidopyrimidine-DNA glycosylase
MPELPEVETVTRSLQPLVGRRILAVEIRGARILRGADPERLAAALAGRRITQVKRYGKFILMSLGGAGYLLLHLGMTGRLLLGGEAAKHTHVILTLDKGTLLFDDSRQFGSFEFSREFPVRIARLGPEPLEIPSQEFALALKRHKVRIKALLLNQAFVRGVGNIYADESLFRAGIHPLALSHRLTAARALRLHRAIAEVLSDAIDAGGSSISDYVDAEGRKGFFQVQHRVYQRTGEPCVACGAAIRRLLVAQRSSHFCARCQKR